MKAVLDTDVIVAGMRSATGASRRLLELLEVGTFESVLSVALVLEYEAVLKRPKHQTALGLTVEDIDEFIDGILRATVLVVPFYSWRPTLTDPNDEMVLETAINGGVSVIVTFNTRHLAEAAQRFGIEVLRPGEFLRRIQL